MPEHVAEIYTHSPTEAVVGRIWGELLRLERVNPQDNLFEMGGDSLVIMMMLFKIEDVLGVKIRPGVVMEAPTLREFCRIIDKQRSGILPASEGEQRDSAVVPSARKSNLPVSFIQEQVIGAELRGLYDPEKTKSHCLDLCYRIRGAIDTRALDKALNEIVRRHEILRTGYSVVNGIIFQSVNDAPPSILHVEDLCNLTQGERERETERILKRIAAQSFSFFHDKVMISATLITSEMEHVLAVIANHIAIDGLSKMLLRKELFSLYQAFSHHEPSPLSDLPIQYADFAIWEREHLSGDRLEERLSYWRKLCQKPLNTALPVDHMPTDHSYAGDTVPVTIPAELTTHLLQLGCRIGVTLFTVLYATFMSLIHVFSGYRYNFFSLPVANRSRGETHSSIGCFMNFQFVYIDLSGNPTFLEIVERLNKTLHDVYDNYVPFHLITQEIPPQGPVVEFQLLTSLKDSETAAAGELSFLPFRLQKHEFALFPIDVRLSESSDGISGYLVYQTAVYDRTTIVDLVDDYVALLTKMARDPNIRLHDMGIEPHRSVVQED